MEVALESNGFLMGIEYVAIFCCGMVGGLAAVRKGYDLTAIVITSWLTALGGGIMRDVMLGVTPVGVSDKGIILTALASGVAVAVIHPEVDKLKWSMLTLDALAVALFAVNGTSKAIGLGSSGTTAVFMGMFTAIGGGMVRDMLINEVPMIIRDRHWYFVPSAVGSVLTVFVCKALQHGWVGMEGEIALDLGVVALVIAMRLLSVRFDITVPGAVARRNVYLPGESRAQRRETARSDAPGRSGEGR
ncbi:TRIC cation channel family protein [Bifidobacterium pullorum subsp. saeculare]|uniref:TRIC cation channel family protein n=1 Tax=Bifidobacterium pullorum subsp. saeculare TaxID=78257 RepID=A0A938WV85_9BIFI|nr:TRIC cation channel family protein [Bifidobacterium pullorum]MBM6699385.1 TRIC cation channel family protein [Bifidobacterium pullorum subsp. saeculare]